ncbi:RNA polymerase II mediator complex subunit [Xylographa trunciseda]|nr:RNA polymerase II mediator complex subunit [Xylographa trunciseda]
MADRLTQLSDCLDQVHLPLPRTTKVPLTPAIQLSTQFYASLRYITTHHPSPSLPRPSSPSNTQPPDAPATTTNSSTHDEVPGSPGQRPDTPDTFAAATRELARDLVLKQKQIEALIGALPGIEKSEEEQKGRIRGLEAELRRMARERVEVVREKEMLVRRVEDVIVKVRRV